MNPVTPLRQWSARLVAWLLATDAQGDQREVLSRFFIAFALVFGLGMTVVLVFGGKGLLGYHALRQEAAGLEADIARLQARKTDLEASITLLRNDPRYVDYLARRDLGLVARGEDVIELPPLDH